MFAVTGLDHRVIGLVVAEDPLHDADGGQVALEIALHRLGTDARRQPDYLRVRRGDAAGLVGDGRGD
ncbi:hypothetical protein D3C80_1645620 [compost metagenome]